MSSLACVGSPSLDDLHGLRLLANEVLHGAKPVLSAHAVTDVQILESKVAELLVIVRTLIEGIR